jgi:glycosyltransferase involved in cell wall biosynthesis
MPSARILVHDYSGHAFPAQLSRRLAARGNEVLHLSSSSVLTPRGAIDILDSDPPTLHFSEIELGQVIEKQAFARRYFQERKYGRLLHARIRDFRPDVVISGNTPLDAQTRALETARSTGACFVFWLQDVQGIAIKRLLSARLGVLGRLAGRYYTAMEQRLLRSSDAVVAISEDFTHVLRDWKVDDRSIWTIPNWASTDEVPERPKDNPWSRDHGVAESFCFLYSGTLGMKHNPGLILELALHYRNVDGVRVVVVSEGAGAQWLAAKGAELGLRGLRVLPFQHYADLPEVLASADVLVTILEPDAGVFSVPSKILSHFCAARPLLLAVPLENLAARIVNESGAGTVVRPDDVQGFLREAERLRGNAERRSRMSESGRQYAARNFDLDQITDRFEQVFEAALARRHDKQA